MNQVDIKHLLEAIRNNCSAGTWSKGVELSRHNRVIGLKQSKEEARFRIELSDSRVAPEVSLFLEDEDWVCSCNSPEDACAHVAAAAISFKHATDQGKNVSSSGAAAHVQYRFEVRGGKIALKRIIIDSGGEEKPFWGDLTSIAAGKKDGPRIAATDIDLQIDRAMAEVDSPELTPKIMGRVLILLRGRDDVTLDGAPIDISPEAIGLCLYIKKSESGIFINCKQDPRVVLAFTNGAILTRNALHPAKHVALDPRIKRYLTSEVHLIGNEIVEFIARDLPVLRKQVSIEGEELLGFQSTRERPYAYIESWRDGTTLKVRPLIAYGKPVLGLVRGGALEAFGQEIPVRLMDAERLLRDQFAKETGLELGRTYDYAGHSAVEFVEEMRHRYVLSDETISDFTIYGELLPQPRFQNNLMEIDFHCGQKEVERSKVFEAWQRGDSLIPLIGGGFAKIPYVWLEQYGKRVLEILAAQKAGASTAALANDIFHLTQHWHMSPPEWVNASVEKVTSAAYLQFPELPEGLKGKLRSYQEEGILWLQKLRLMGLGGLLCDDMGLGKTVQALAAMKVPALIVAPKSLLKNWESEIRKFRPDLSSNIFHGSDRVYDQSDVTITTYHTLRQDIDDFEKRIWETAVFDEAQLIKNPESQIAQSSFRVRAQLKLALSGTPIENSLEDIWSQMNLVIPGYLGSLGFFRKEVLPAIRAGDVVSRENLKRRLKPFILRRLKSEVAKDLPAKTEIVNRIELSNEQQALYEATLNQARKDLNQGQESVASILTYLLRLRQICSHPGLFDKQMSRSELSAKFVWLLEALIDLKQSGNKSLLFSQWTGLLDLLEPVLEEHGIKFLRLDGSTKDRQGVVDSFTKGSYDILIMSLKAGGVGLNLTIADHVFLFDPWWNPAVEAQAIDRVHRIGQDKPVFVHKMIALDTIEERVLALQEKKSELSDIFIGDGMQESRLGKDELLSLVFDR